MKKIILFILTITLLLSGCGTIKSTTANLQQNSIDPSTVDDTYTIILSDVQYSSHPSVLANYKFKRLVEAKSDGKIQVNIYDDSKLGSEVKTNEMLQNGSIQMSRVSVVTLEKYNSRYGLLSLPFLYENSEQMFRVLESDYCYEFMYPEEDTNFIGLAWYDSGARNFYTVDKPIYSVDDMEDLTIRVMESDVMAEFVSTLGANPIKLPFGDITTSAFENKEIDGAENIIPAYINAKHYKYAKYVTLSEHMRTPQLLIINKDFYNNLPADYQKLIKDCAEEASFYQRTLIENTEKDWLNLAKEHDITFIELSSIEKSKFQEKALEQYKNLSYEDAVLIDLLLSIK